jgi:hypothetical protein
MNDIINIVKKAYVEGFLTIESSRILVQVDKRYSQLHKIITATDIVGDGKTRDINTVFIKDMNIREIFETCKILIGIAYKNKFFSLEFGNNVTNLMGVITEFFK